LFPLKEQKHCHQKRFLASKCSPNAFAAGVLPQTLLGKLTARPQTGLAGWIRGGEGEMGGEGKGREKTPNQKSGYGLGVTK